ncbi:MAG: hypothetical protein ACM3S2_13595 [Ignavibacteriales bacterium]
MNNNKRPVLLFGLAIIFSLILSYIPEGIQVFTLKTKPVSFFMDIKPDSLLSMNRIPGKYSDNFASVTNVISPSEKTRVIEASFPGQFLFDLMNGALSSHSNNSCEIVSDIPETSVGLSGNVAQMKNFFQALKQSKSKGVRIAHYGDSNIEGDLIDVDVRQNLQNEFGGLGAGFLSITSQDISFRESIRQSFSSDWKIASVVNGKDATLPVGISGFVSVPGNNSWVKYETAYKYSSTRSFKTVKLYYSDAKNSSIKYSFNNGPDQSAALVAGKGVKELVLNAPGEGKSIKITATMAGQANFYGVSLESGNGLYLDNFPWRGNTGVSFRDIMPQILTDFNKYLNYKLIILSFGGNMLSAGNVNFNWYETQMIKVINDLKQQFPQASILMVSVGDRAIKKGPKFGTDPNVPLLVESQKKIANATGITFWNSFEAMGGMNSMVNWVNSNMASKDYGHLLQDGSKKMASYLTKAILNEYRKY